MGAGGGYTHLTENIASPSGFLQHCLHQMSRYYFICGEKNKQINLAFRHTVRTKITSFQVTASLSLSSVCLFTWKINRKMVTEMQHKVSIEVAAAGHSAGVEVVRGKSPVASWPY